jgi:hypothetical protein
VDLNLELATRQEAPPRSLVVTRTGRQTDADIVGRVRLVDGAGSLTLPARSVTTLASPSIGAGADIP